MGWKKTADFTRGWGRDNRKWLIYSYGKTKNSDMPKSQIIIEEYSTGWNVERRTFSDYGITKTYTDLKKGFESKSKALKFARTYMRAHPNG